METTQKSFDVAKRKGEFGELIVKAWLEAKGLVVYRPVTDCAHAFDMLAIKDKRVCVALDVKAKARRNKYPDTGINVSHYNTYKEFSEKHRMAFWMFFVDEGIGEIYGNTLSELDKPRFVGEIRYPLLWRGYSGRDTIYWPLCAMKTIHKLSDAEKLELVGLSQRTHEFLPSVVWE